MPSWLVREHPVSTFISCWHRSDHESAAMWEIYQREGRGVVLQTTWGRLTTSLDDPRTIFGGYVTYADYAKTLPPFDHELNIYFYKRPYFEFEREVRLICVDRSHDPDSPPVTTGQLYPRPHQSLTLRAP